VKFLKPQPLQPHYFQPVQKDLDSIFYEILYKPIVTLLKDYTTQRTFINSAKENYSIIERALKNGDIQYQDGVFSGRFNAAISKQLRDMGAKFDDKSKTFKVTPEKVPLSIIQQASLTQREAKELHEGLKSIIDKAESNSDIAFSIYDIPSDKVISSVDMGWREASKGLGVMPTLSEVSKKKLAAGYTDNVKTYSKKYAQEQFRVLRDIVQDNSMSGARYDTLISMLEDDYSATKRKAEQIARQETANFMSEFRKEKFTESGVVYYKWSARSMARPDHRALNNLIFRYDRPPIVNRDTGKRGNPGTDFGCLCGDIPILGALTSQMLKYFQEAA
jgi:SPP1 gp7 family putative phage head morphogenesis protein